jgi:hypothetical protein
MEPYLLFELDTVQQTPTNWKWMFIILHQLSDINAKYTAAEQRVLPTKYTASVQNMEIS